jgi:hypothetical protein
LAHKITAWIVGIFVAYSLGAYASLYLLNRVIPAWAENLIVTIALPLQLLFTPWMELLRNAGLTEGEWIRTPTVGGFLLIIAVYALALYALIGAFFWYIRRS